MLMARRLGRMLTARPPLLVTALDGPFTVLSHAGWSIRLVHQLRAALQAFSFPLGALGLMQEGGPMGLLNREITASEREELERRCRSRTESIRRVERAQIILDADVYVQWTAVARVVGVDKKTVRTWVDRFEQSGLKGLEDAPRSGHPFIYTAEIRAEVVSTALTPPRELGQPFGSWTVERLEVYFNEVRGIPIKHSRIHEILAQEGLRWHHEENWLGEKVDPAFLKKRGPLSRHTRPRLRVL